MRLAITYTIGLSLVISFLTTRSWVAAQYDDVSDKVGVTGSGLVGIDRTGIPVSSAPAIAIAATAGYGVTESIAPVHGVSHRLRGVLGGAFSIADFLSLGVSLDGRYHRHPRDEAAAASGWVGDPRILARTGYWLGRSMQLGGELVLWIPGSSAPSLVPKATTVDAKLLAAYVPLSNPWTITALAGFRLDNTRNSIDQPDRLSSGDRIALGISDYHACLVGAGASVRISELELLAELTSDILVGRSAPNVLSSPIRADAGVRYRMTKSLQLEWKTEFSLSKRPDISAGRPLTPIEPRFGVFVGIRYFVYKVSARPAETSPTIAPSAPPIAPAKEKFAQVQGQVLDQNDQPIEGAQVSLSAESAVMETKTDAAGQYRFEHVAFGPAKLKAHADGYEDLEWPVQVVQGRTAQEPRRLKPVAIEPRLPAGQLRGLIRSFDGKPLAARIGVKPIGLSGSTDAKGFFQIDVPPGTYQVTIEAHGYRKQKREVQIEDNGVSILNVEMREANR